MSKVFEYKDDFLMGSISGNAEIGGDPHLCQMADPADDQLTSLASLVGGGERLARREREAVAEADEPEAREDHHFDTERAPLAPVEPADIEAPRLEFDLEDELSRAFPSAHPAPVSPTPAPQPGSVFDTHAIQQALSAAPEAMEPVSQEPDYSGADESGLARLINEEFERTGEIRPADVAADGYEPDEFESAADTQVSEPVHAGSEPTPRLVEESEGLDHFSQELSRLMDEVDSEARHRSVEPPAPIEALAPFDEATIVEQAEAAQFVVDPTPPPQPLDWKAPHETDFRFETAPDSSLREAHAQDVIDRADALGSAAMETTNHYDEIALDDDLERALSQDLSSALNDPAFEYHDEGVTVDTVPAAGLAERRKAGWRVAASIVAVALLGGVAALAWSVSGGDENTPPPTILADSQPAKVKPDETGGKVVPNQDQSVYEAVGGEKPAEPQQTELKDSTEQPITVARQTSEPAEADTTQRPIVKPRRVRTVVVRPDGTIVQRDVVSSSTAQQDAGGQTLVADQNSVSSEEPIDVAATADTSQTDIVAPASAVEAITSKAEKDASGSVASITDDNLTGEEAGTQIAADAPVTLPKPKPSRVARVETPNATSSTARPVAAELQNTASLPTSSAPFAVQVSSQRSADAARQTYRDLSRRFAGIIGGKGVDYQQKVVNGATYYRVRIPAQSRAEAQDICTRLKASGGDCFVTR